MIKLFDILQEITGKPKAIFLAGPAGSGKTYTLNQLLPVEKYQVINVDDTYEELLKSSGLGTNLKDFGPEELSQAAKLMGRAQGATKEKYAKALEGLNNVIIDGTGAASKPLFKKKAELEAKKLEAKKEREEKRNQEKAEKAAAKKATAKKQQKKEAVKVEKAKVEVVEEAVQEEAVQEEAKTPEKVTVTRATINGKQYLKSSNNILYDPESKEEVGLWDPESKTIKELPEDEEEEEEEYEEDD